MKMNLIGVLDKTFIFLRMGAVKYDLDDGGDLTNMVLDRYPYLVEEIRGLSEETTTGVHRLYERMDKGTLIPQLT